MDKPDNEQCEACDKPATHHDSEGVPLCDDCWETLLMDYASDHAEDL